MGWKRQMVLGVMVRSRLIIELNGIHISHPSSLSIGHPPQFRTGGPTILISRVLYSHPEILRGGSRSWGRGCLNNSVASYICSPDLDHFQASFGKNVMPLLLVPFHTAE